MGNLKEKIVDDGVRAKVYGALRVPLNVFVVVGLGLTRDGNSSLLIPEMSKMLTFLQARDIEMMFSGFVVVF